MSEIGTTSESKDPKQGKGTSTTSKFFDTSSLQSDLKGRSVRGGAITLVAQIIRFLLSTAGTMVLARLLAPSDYGLVAMVSPITGFVAMFRDMGLSAATVQREHIKHEQISTLFWITLGLSVMSAAIAIILAPVIGWFYHDSRVIWITIASACVFIPSGISAQHVALLNRQMRFRSIAVIDIMALAVALLTGIVGALCGMHFWALIAMNYGSSITYVVMGWVLTGWRPGKPVRHSGVRSMLKFGGNLTTYNIAGYLSRNLDNVLVGRYCGDVALGLYSRAYNLLMLQFNQIVIPLSSVAVPAMTRLQSEPTRLARYYLKALNICALLTFPFVVLLIIVHREVILLVLGPNWIEVAPIFEMLAISAAIQPALSSLTWLYVSTGNTARLAKWGMFSTPVIIISFIVGLPQGGFGVARAYSIAMLLLVIPAVVYAARGLPLRLPDFARALRIPVLIAAVGALGCTLVKRIFFTPQLPSIVAVTVSGIVMLLSYVLVLAIIPKERQEYVSIFREFRRVRANRAP
jgi:PST family polysaccharide transporter